MAIEPGYQGKVSWDPLGGAALVEIISIKTWKGSFKRDYEDVTCFGNTNLVWLPNLMNIEGTFEGHFNPSELSLFKAAMQSTPGMLELMANRLNPIGTWKGPAYMGADIDCTLQAPKVTADFKASDNWTVPGMVTATAAAPGTGTGTYTPAGATPPQNFAALSGVTASPATAWTTGQFILLADGTKAHWNGTAWATGAKP